MKESVQKALQKLDDLSAHCTLVKTSGESSLSALKNLVAAGTASTKKEQLNRDLAENKYALALSNLRQILRKYLQQ